MASPSSLNLEEVMANELKKKQKKKPFNHVLEIQNGTIDIRDLFRRIDGKIRQKQEAQNG